MFHRRPVSITQDEISTMIGDIASLQRSRDKAAQADLGEEWDLINSNIISANQALAYLLDSLLEGKGKR